MISTHTYTASVPGAPSTALALEAGSVELDSSSAPHVNATITVPATAALLDIIDPRQGRRVLITADAVFPSFSQSRSFNLGIRRMRPNRAAGDVTLSLASDEALLMDFAPLVVDTGARAYETSLRAVVGYVLGKIGATLQPGSLDADVTAYWSITNLLPNPSGEVNAANWAGGTGAGAPFRQVMGSPVAPSGAAAIGWTASAAGDSNIVPVTGGAAATYAVRPGQWYVFSFYLCSTVSRTARAVIQWWSSNGTVLSSQSFGDPITSVNTAFRRAWVIAQAPKGASHGLPYVNTLGNAAGNTHYADCAMFYEGNELVPYYDGSTPAGGGYTYSWSKDVHGSTSTREPVTERRPELFAWQPGVDAWDFLAPLVQAAGFRLVCDGNRRWTLRATDYREPGSLTIRWGVNLTSADEEASRDGDDWFDGMVIRYRWRDLDGTEQTRDDAYALPGATKIARREINAPYPGPGRAQYAVQRAKGKGRSITVSAVADWTAACDENLTITLDTPGSFVGVAERVSFDISADEMTITSRTTDVPAGAIDLLAGTIDALPGTIDAL